MVGKNDNLIKELNAIALNKKVGNQDIEIKNTPTYDKNVKAQILFIYNEQAKSISEIASKNKGKGLILVTENPNFCKHGAIINFTVNDNKLKFEYSKSNAVKLGLKTNDDFKTLAIPVD